MAAIQGVEEQVELEDVQEIIPERSPEGPLETYGRELLIMESWCLMFRLNRHMQVLECSNGRIRLFQSWYTPERSRIDFIRKCDGQRSMNFGLRYIHNLYNHDGVQHVLTWQIRGIEEEIRLRFYKHAEANIFKDKIFTYAQDPPRPEDAFNDLPEEKKDRVLKRIQKRCVIS